MNQTIFSSPSIADLSPSAVLEYSCDIPALEITPVAPVRFEKRDGYYAIDFGKAVWGNLQIAFERVPISALTVRLGEKLGADGKIDRHPPGSVVFREVVLKPQAGQTLYLLDLPHQEMHDDVMALESQAGLGEITAFRYAEIEAGEEPLVASQVRQLFVHTAFDDDTSDFQCSDATLNAVWQLCKHTIKASTAFGIYIDGDRERIPYEADAYINQLSHLACDFNPAVGRASLEHLLRYPTWPTEWNYHIIMMVAADYEATGDLDFVARHYVALHQKLLMDRAREDGLLRVGANIDWPPCERDGYNNGEIDPHDPNYVHPQLGPEINTVANAFYFHGLQCMAFLAGALGKSEDQKFYQATARKVFDAFNQQFFDSALNRYIDGVSPEGHRSDHVSLHANMFALVFDLVPPEKVETIADYVRSRGMACSVYAAQYLLESLYRSGHATAGLELMTAQGKRSWWHMIERGSTMTWEAWDEDVKPNLTWNHAWGASPANIITRFLLGVRPLEVGYGKTIITPQPGTLEWASGKVPTPLGAVHVSFQQAEGFCLEVTIPHGMTAQVRWPQQGAYLLENGVATLLELDAKQTTVEPLRPGHHILTSRP
jgi:alpha-L-rhamnosidase